MSRKIKVTNNIDEGMKALKKAENLALTAIGEFVTGRAKLETPVDTGKLRQSIDNEVLDDSVVIGTNTEYAIYVEKGTRHQQAQPYLEPAVTKNKGKIKKIIEEIYKKEVDD